MKTSSSQKKGVSVKSLLENQAWFVLPLAVGLYLTSHHYLTKFIESNPWFDCHVDLPMPLWGRAVNFGCAFALSGNSILQTFFALKYLAEGDSSKKSLLSMHLAILTVHCIAGASQYFTYFGYQSNVCVDGFGVTTFSSQWSEWLVSVPLLAYLSCSIVAKPSLYLSEWMLLVNIVSMIVTGFMIILDPAHRYQFFMVSTVNMLAIPLLSRMIDDQDIVAICSHRVQQMSTNSETAAYLVTRQQKWRRKMLWRLFLVCWLFPLVYLLRATKMIEADACCIAFLLCSLVGKLLFSSSLASSYMSLFEQLQMVSVSIHRANETRRTFLRYVFHELRIPLNSLAMGMQLMGDIMAPIKNLSEEDRQLFESMQNTTSLLVDNVNQVLALHRIRDGEMTLASVSFDVRAWLQHVISSTQSIFVDAEITCGLEVSEEVPLKAIGDPEKWQLMLQSLFSSLVTCVGRGGKLQVTISLRPPAKESVREVKVHSCCKDNFKDYSDNAFSKALDIIKDGLMALFNIFFSNLLPIKIKQLNTITLDEGTTKCALYLSFSSNHFKVSPREMKTLFEPFNGLRTADQQRAHGTGLGIVLAAEILQLQEGSELKLLDADFHLPQEVNIRLMVNLPLSQQQSSTTNQRLKMWKSENNLFSQLRTSSSRDSLVDLASYNRAFSAESSPLQLQLPEDYIAVDKSSSVMNFSYASSTTPATLSAESWAAPSLSSVLLAVSGLQPEDQHNELMKRTLSFTTPKQQLQWKINSGSNSNNGGDNNCLSSSSSSSCCEGNSLQHNIGLSLESAPCPSVVSSSILAAANGVMHVLVVDDTPSNSKMLSHALTRRGHICSTAENGREAVEKIQRDMLAFDLVMMDNTMPVMSGVDATAHLRRLGFNRLIIGVTGNVLDDDVQSFLRAGADTVILKPLRVKELDLILQYISDQGNSLHEPLFRLQIIQDKLEKILFEEGDDFYPFEE